MKKFLTGIAIAVASMLLLPMTSAHALLDDALTSIAAVATGTVTLTSGAPVPTAPFDVVTGEGDFGGLVMAGAFTANSGKAVAVPDVCVGQVAASGPIHFVTQQDLLVGGGAIDGGVSVVPGDIPGTCTGTGGLDPIIANFAGGGFVRAGVVAVAIFQLEDMSPTAAGTGDTLGTFVGIAIPAGPPLCTPIPNFACSEIAGPVVG